MKIDVLTIFPEFIETLKAYGVIGKAIESNRIDFSVSNIRDYSTNKHKRVDDTVYGGAAGMLMTMQPLVDAIEDKRTNESHVVFLSPQGKVLNQQMAVELAERKHLILLCGHYEGIDARVIHNYVDEEISIGDYVLTGGELPAMVLVDAVSRWLPGVLGNEDSASTDSLYNGLLQHDEYTKPRTYLGYEVPEVLVSGDHQKIAAWRKENSIEKTKKIRPDLYEAYLNNKEKNSN